LDGLAQSFATAAATKIDDLPQRKTSTQSPTGRRPIPYFPDVVGLKQEGHEHFLPYAGVAFKAFGLLNELRQTAIERSTPLLSAFCQDRFLRDSWRTFSPLHRRIVTTYALKIGAPGEGDNRDHSLSALWAVCWVHEMILPILPP
jgi:hypothetical protein